MDTATALWSFGLLVGLLTLTPGLDTALILRTAVLGRRRRAWGVVLGIQTGTLVWGVLASAGATAVLTASHLAYETLRWAGAGYLLWMGARMLRDSFRTGDAAPAEAAQDGPDPAADGGGLVAGWRRGALTNLLNPKVGVFYIALLPQFIPPGAPHLAFGVLLTCEHLLLGVAWSAVLIGFARVLRHWLAGPTARRVLDRITGGVIAAWGGRGGPRGGRSPPPAPPPRA
ncbi:LysE family translocator, partial [Kitasatospora sp. NPDC059571]|uniref:LysE family translocator n=1 Tax=Kitasatospora sp. NPDC059571 TaxID=3346871 RepID=UPI00367F286F